MNDIVIIITEADLSDYGVDLPIQGEHNCRLQRRGGRGDRRVACNNPERNFLEGGYARRHLASRH